MSTIVAPEWEAPLTELGSVQGLGSVGFPNSGAEMLPPETANGILLWEFVPESEIAKKFPLVEVVETLEETYVAFSFADKDYTRIVLILAAFYPDDTFSNWELVENLPTRTLLQNEAPVTGSYAPREITPPPQTLLPASGAF